MDPWHEIEAARLRLADLLDTLTPAEWEHSSLCDGWRVRDVAAHLTLAPQFTWRGLVVDLVKARGDFNRFIHDTAVRQAELPTAEIVAQIRASAGSRRTPPGTNMLNTIMDVLTHTQDIAGPLGREVEIPPAAAKIGADRLWSMGFPFNARKRFGGFHLVATDSDWAAGSGPLVEGPTSAMLQLLSGRPAALDRLTGEGVPSLATALQGK